jgi:hypothetical protein
MLLLCNNTHCNRGDPKIFVSLSSRFVATWDIPPTQQQQLGGECGKGTNVENPLLDLNLNVLKNDLFPIVKAEANGYSLEITTRGRRQNFFAIKRDPLIFCLRHIRGVCDCE